MKVLVTGGAGFIGTHTVDLLIQEGIEVVVLDSLDPQVHGRDSALPVYLEHHIEEKKLNFIRGDVQDGLLLKTALREVDAVIHLAAAVGVGQSMYQPYHYISVNAGGTSLLLDILANEKHRVKKIVVASSMSIYGEGVYRCRRCGSVHPHIRSDEQLKIGKWELTCPHCSSILEPMPTDESKHIEPTSIYAISKKVQEELVLTFGKAYKIPAVALRYFNVYGPRQSLNNPYTGVVAIFLSRLLNGKPPLIFEDGKQSRDFIHVSDIAKANLLALTSAEGDYQALNVGTGTATTILQVAETLAEVLNLDIQPEVINKYRSGDIRHCYADNSLIKETLGFEAQVNFNSGIADLIAWCQDQQPVDLVEQSFNELRGKGLVS